MKSIETLLAATGFPFIARLALTHAEMLAAPSVQDDHA